MTRFAAVLLLMVALGGALVLLSSHFPARARKVIAAAGWFLLYAVAALVFLIRIF
jgi:hypothetical protein